MDVAVLRWPEEERRREALRVAGRPRVLILEPDAAPTIPCDELEDWIRAPASEADLLARIEGLRRRLDTTTPAALEPELDEDGVLRLGEQWIALPPVEARLTGALLDGFGTVVSRGALASAGWPGATPARNALDVHVLRLRRRLSPLDLAIRTVRSRGYLLERVTSPA